MGLNIKISKLQNLQDLNFANKKVLLRCDINVPFDSKQALLDNTKIINLAPTVRFLLKQKAKILLISHLGRPDGQYKDHLSLKNLIPYLEKYLTIKIKFLKHLSLNDNLQSINQLKNNEIALLENLRFFKAEQDNDQEFGRLLSKLADVYINDAFSCCHRRHASIDAVTQFMPSYGGLLLKNELKTITNILNIYSKPMTLIIGGKKISTKIKTLVNLINKVDKIFIAGAMANNFLKSLGYQIGKSFYEIDNVNDATQMYVKNKDKIFLPNDFVGINNGKIVIKNIDNISQDDCLFDIGMNSCRVLKEIIENSKTIIWNGPVGFYEEPQFATASLYIANVIACCTKHQGLSSIICGGDTVAITKLSGLKDDFSYISTGGGAFLELIEKENLIGLNNLIKAKL